MSYQIEAETRNLDISGKMGPFEITNGRGFISLNNDGLSAMGRVEANGVDGGFSWQQPFGAANADDARLAVHGFSHHKILLIWGKVGPLRDLKEIRILIC